MPRCYGTLMVLEPRIRKRKNARNLSQGKFLLLLYYPLGHAIAKKIECFWGDEFRNQVVPGRCLGRFRGNTNWQDELTQVGVVSGLQSIYDDAKYTNDFLTSPLWVIRIQEGHFENSRFETLSGKLI